MRPLRFMYRKLERIEVANLDFIPFFSLVGPVGHSKPIGSIAGIDQNSAHKDPILFFWLAVLPACYEVALDAKGRCRIGGGQITPRRSYFDQGGTTPLLRAYAIDCPRCSC